MRARNLLFAQFGIIAILAGLHLIAIENFLYWKLSWFDLLAHFIGGMWAALFATWFLALRRREPSILFCLLGALGFGIVWEVFEVSALLTKFPDATLDTIKDISLAVLGGIAGAYLAKYISHEDVSSLLR